MALAGTGFLRREPDAADSVTVEAGGSVTGQKPCLLRLVHCGAKTYQASRENAVARGQPAAITEVSCVATVLSADDMAQTVPSAATATYRVASPGTSVIEICQLNPIGATSEGSTCPSMPAKLYWIAPTSRPEAVATLPRWIEIVGPLAQCRLYRRVRERPRSEIFRLPDANVCSLETWAATLADRLWPKPPVDEPKVNGQCRGQGEVRLPSDA